MFQRQSQLDSLNRTLLITGICCALLNGLLFSRIVWLRIPLSVLAAGCLIFAVIRLLGGNPARRNQENMRFLTIVTAVRNWFYKTFQKRERTARTHRAQKARKNPTWSEIKQYKYFICPQCAQRLRVPRGKGKLRVTCTRCGNVFETKS